MGHGASDNASAGARLLTAIDSAAAGRATGGTGAAVRRIADRQLKP
jgi:hypothetical protein